MTREQLDAIRARVDFDDVSIHDVIPLLAEVKRLHEENTVLVEANEGEPWAWQVLTKQRDAALAEVERLRDAHAMAVQVSGELCEKCGWAMKFPGEKCRCELLAEVERLTADPLPAAAWVREVERAAFARGVAAMREAAVKEIYDKAHYLSDDWADDIRALSDPEDKP